MIGTVISVRDHSFWYLACSSCFCKVSREFLCDKCGATKSKYRYRLSLKVESALGIVVVTIFGKCLEEWFGIGADDFVSLYENDSSLSEKQETLIKCVDDVFVGHSFIFEVSKKQGEGTYIALSMKSTSKKRRAFSSVVDSFLGFVRSSDNQSTVKQANARKLSQVLFSPPSWNQLISHRCSKEHQSVSDEHNGKSTSPLRKLCRSTSWSDLFTQNQSRLFECTPRNDSAFTARSESQKTWEDEIYRIEAESLMPNFTRATLPGRKSLNSSNDDSLFVCNYPLIPPTCLNVSDLSDLPLDDVTLPLPLEAFEEDKENFMQNNEGKNSATSFKIGDFNTSRGKTGNMSDKNEQFLTNSVLEDLNQTFPEDNSSNVPEPDFTPSCENSPLYIKNNQVSDQTAPMRRCCGSKDALCNDTSLSSLFNTPQSFDKKVKTPYSKFLQRNFSLPAVSNSTPKMGRILTRLSKSTKTNTDNKDYSPDSVILSSLPDKENCIDPDIDLNDGFSLFNETENADSGWNIEKFDLNSSCIIGPSQP